MSLFSRFYYGLDTFDKIILDIIYPSICALKLLNINHDPNRLVPEGENFHLVFPSQEVYFSPLFQTEQTGC